MHDAYLFYKGYPRLYSSYIYIYIYMNIISFAPLSTYILKLTTLLCIRAMITRLTEMPFRPESRCKRKTILSGVTCRVNESCNNEKKNEYTDFFKQFRQYE